MKWIPQNLNVAIILMSLLVTTGARAATVCASKFKSIKVEIEWGPSVRNKDASSLNRSTMTDAIVTVSDPSGENAYEAVIHSSGTSTRCGLVTRYSALLSEEISFYMSDLGDMCGGSSKSNKASLTINKNSPAEKIYYLDCDLESEDL